MARLLEVAARRAREAGIDNLETAVCDGEQLDVPAESSEP